MGKSMFGYSSGNRAARFAYDMMVLEEIEKGNKTKQTYKEEDYLNDYGYDDDDIFEEDLD